MIEDLNELKKKFILDQDIEHEDIKNLISRIVKFCKIDKNGGVLIQKKMPNVDKIMLFVSARYLAKQLQEKIGEDVTIDEKVNADELSRLLRLQKNIVIARMKNLKDNGMITTLDKGIYKALPYAIEDFLKKMESRDNGK